MPVCPQLAAAMAAPTEEELEARSKAEYQSYLETENKFLRELGIIADDDTA